MKKYKLNRFLEQSKIRNPYTDVFDALSYMYKDTGADIIDYRYTNRFNLKDINADLDNVFGSGNSVVFIFNDKRSGLDFYLECEYTIETGEYGVHAFFYNYHPNKIPSECVEYIDWKRIPNIDYTDTDDYLNLVFDIISNFNKYFKL